MIPGVGGMPHMTRQRLPQGRTCTNAEAEAVEYGDGGAGGVGEGDLTQLYVPLEGAGRWGQAFAAAWVDGRPAGVGGEVLVWVVGG